MSGENSSRGEILHTARDSRSPRERMRRYLGAAVATGALTVAAKTGVIDFSYEGSHADKPANLDISLGNSQPNYDLEVATDDSQPISRVYVYRNVETALRPERDEIKGHVIGSFVVKCAKYSYASYPADVMRSLQGVSTNMPDNLGPSVLRVDGENDRGERVIGWMPYSSDLDLRGYIPQCGPPILIAPQPVDKDGHVGPIEQPLLP